MQAVAARGDVREEDLVPRRQDPNKKRKKDSGGKSYSSMPFGCDVYLSGRRESGEGKKNAGDVRFAGATNLDVAAPERPVHRVGRPGASDVQREVERRFAGFAVALEEWGQVRGAMGEEV